MSKAVLILDMPENCIKCKLQDWAHCKIVKRCHTGNSRPDWCPLKPMPEKRETTDNLLEMFANILRNDCIDELLKGEEG